MTLDLRFALINISFLRKKGVWVPHEANVLATIATAAAVPPSIARVM
jgi:hypothetical protein